MSMTYGTFTTQFPEFSATDADMVSAMLAASLLEINVAVWGALADQGQAYLTAHKLAISPFGQQARLVQKDGSTTYELEYKRLCSAVASGYRVC